MLPSFALNDFSVHHWLVNLLDAGLFIATLLRQDTERANSSDYWNNHVQPALFQYNSTVRVNYTPHKWAGSAPSQLNAMPTTLWDEDESEELPW